MLRSAKALLNYRLLATNGKIGTVDDFLFDDDEWTVRYLVASTGGWLKGRLVLISPAALRRPDWQAREFPVDLTQKQIEESPSILSDAPVARQKEVELARHYNWPVYWAIDGLGGFGAAPIVAPLGGPQAESRLADEGNPHLRGVREVRGYRIHATDGDIGHVDDFIVDDERWKFRYVVVDTKSWLPGGEVLLACDWIEKVSWDDAKVLVRHSRDEVRNSPKYDPSAPVNREYEEVLHDYYGRPRYWEQTKQPAHSGKSGRRR